MHRGSVQTDRAWERVRRAREIAYVDSAKAGTAGMAVGTGSRRLAAGGEAD